MKRTYTYLAQYKHLGPVQIIINDMESTVISILGIRSFCFSRLLRNRNNRYAILKLSMKNYLNCFIDNFEGIGIGKKEPKKEKIGGLLGLIANFVSALTLESSDPIEKLKGLITKDHKEFDWENVDAFLEVENSDNILGSFCIPILVQFENFERDFLTGEETLEVSERDILSFRVQHKAVEYLEKIKMLKNFIISEINFYREIREYEEPCFKSIIKAHESLVQSLLVELEVAKDALDFQLDHKILASEIENSSTIAEVYLANFELFQCYFNFIIDFENIIDEGCDLKVKMAGVLSKLTSYFKVFSNICEIDDCRAVREVSVKFYRLNRLLNSHSEKLQLVTLKSLKEQLEQSYPYFASEHILGSMCCTSSDEHEATYTLLLTTTLLTVLDQSNRIKLLTKMSSTDLLIYNRSIWIVFQKVVINKLPTSKATNEAIRGVVYAVRLGLFDREAAENFQEKFYSSKYNYKRKDGYFYYFKNTTTEGFTSESEDDLRRSVPGSPGSDTFQGILVVSNVVDDDRKIISDNGQESTETNYTVRIEDYHFRVGGLETLTQKEVMRQVNERIWLKKMDGLNDPRNLGVIITLMQNTCRDRLKPFCLDMYPEDEIKFIRKIEIFDQICARILAIESKEDQSRSSRDSIYRLLDLSTSGESSDPFIKHFNRKYYTMLYFPPGTDCDIALLPLEEAVILLSMVVYRNIHYLFNVNNIEKIGPDAIWWEQPKKLSDQSEHSAKNLRLIILVIKHLHKINEEAYKDMLIDVLYFREIQNHNSQY